MGTDLTLNAKEVMWMDYYFAAPDLDSETDTDGEPDVGEAADDGDDFE